MRNMKKIFLFTALLAVFTVACTEVDNVINPEENDNQSNGPIILRAELQKRVVQDNEFALDLFKKTIENSGESNVFISPLSMSIALGMALNGADGTTKTEMETALKMSGMSSDIINEYYKIMLESLPKADSLTKLLIANSIWCHKGFQVKQPFLDINAAYFDAEIRSLDFSKDWAKDTINNWCSRKTNNLIKDVIITIPPLAMMYVINAVYFKGEWAEKFDEKNTYSVDFTDEKSKVSKVNMMHSTDSFPYYEDSYAQYLEMPYGNGSYSMTVILPANGKTISDVLDNLNSDRLNTALGNLQKQNVSVSFPRFKTECRYEMSDMLEDMGMKRAFQLNAEFTKICDEDLYISSVIHKTYVEVTEEGTEAAAVTVIEFKNTSLPNYPNFTANKPFIFLIREKGTGVFLFAGKMGSVEKY